MPADEVLNSYVSDMPQRATKVCDPPAAEYSNTDLMTLYPRGLASDSLAPDATTGRIPVAQLQAHLQSLEQTGVLQPRPMVRLTNETDMDSLVAQDARVYQAVQDEYCYYEQRYRYALKKFLTLATSRSPSDNTSAQSMIINAKMLNLRVNCILELMNYMAQKRVDSVNTNKKAVNESNASINKKLVDLKAMYERLNKENAIVTTQREMVRYTEEKNNYTTNQFGVWVALNVLALGAIYFIYKS